MKEAAHSEYISSNVRKINPDAVLRYLIEAGDQVPADSTVQKISRAFGIGCGDVRNIIKKNKLQDRLEEHVLTKIYTEKAMELYNQGKSDNEIAKVFGVASTTVWSWRKARGLDANFTPAEKGVAHQPKTAHERQDYKDERKEIAVDSEKPARKPSTINQDWEKAVDDMLASQKHADVLPVIEAPDADDLLDEVEEKNAAIQELLVKNAELAGFIEGLKFALRFGRLVG